MSLQPPRTPTGEALVPMGWTGKHSAIRKALSGGASLVVRDPLNDTAIDDAHEWWTKHGGQVRTDDHEPEQPWPDVAYFVPTVWRSPEGKVVLMSEHC